MHTHIGLYKYSSPMHIMHNTTQVNFSVWDSNKELCSGFLPGAANRLGKPFPSVTPSWSKSPHTPQSDSHFPSPPPGTQRAA